MRLIDADWLLEHRYKELVSYDTYDLEEMLKWVPTVEQKHGHWIGEQRERWIYAKCSECGKVSDTGTPYCPYCGAKMCEEESND